MTRRLPRGSRSEKVRARHRIGMRVYLGQMPPASALSCTDCGGQATDYDHYRGYECEDVEPVCRPCHAGREKARRRADHPHEWVEMASGRCRTCWNEYRNEYRAKNIDRVRAYERKMARKYREQRFQSGVR